MDIEKLVRDMGYIWATPKNTPTPSYYKLKDGTILSVLTRVHHALILSSGGAVGHTIETFTFTPLSLRRIPKQTQSNPPTIIDQDVKFTTLKEEFNEYTVGNDITVSVKTIVSQIAKLDTYSSEGEPVYSISSQPVFKVVDKRRNSSV